MVLRIVCSTIFALAAITAWLLSASMLGQGFWGWAMLAAGLIVGASPHVAALEEFGRTLALLAGILALIATALGLLAGSIGGTAGLKTSGQQLLALLATMGITGLIAARSSRVRPPEES